MDATDKRSGAKNRNNEHWRNLAKNIVWVEETKSTMGVRVRLLYVPSNIFFHSLSVFASPKWSLRTYIHFYLPILKSAAPQKRNYS